MGGSHCCLKPEQCSVAVVAVVGQGVRPGELSSRESRSDSEREVEENRNQWAGFWGRWAVEVRRRRRAEERWPGQ